MHLFIKSSFYIIFLGLSLFVSLRLLFRSRRSTSDLLLGLFVLVLGVGEGFHIVPRIIELFTGDTVLYSSAIEIGRVVSSSVILFTYTLLIFFNRMYNDTTESKKIYVILLVLGLIGVLLNVVYKDSVNYSVILLRNLPLMGIGLYVILQLKQSMATDSRFKYLWLALILSLVFTLGFELLSSNYEFFIILMMPKVLMFIWVIVMGMSKRKV